MLTGKTRSVASLHPGDSKVYRRAHALKPAQVRGLVGCAQSSLMTSIALRTGTQGAPARTRDQMTGFTLRTSAPAVDPRRHDVRAEPRQLRLTRSTIPARILARKC